MPCLGVFLKPLHKTSASRAGEALVAADVLGRRALGQGCAVAGVAGGAGEALVAAKVLGRRASIACVMDKEVGA